MEVKAGQLFFAVALLLATSGFAEASNGFLCVGEQSTGFARKAGEWKLTSFSVGKYVVVNATQKDKEHLASVGIPSTEWVLKYVGIEMAVKRCVKVPIGMNCGDGDFVLNEKTLRFVYTDTIAYLTEMKLPKDISPTANLEIGTCSVF